MNPSGGWEAKLLPVMGEALRRRRHGTGRGLGHSWYITRGMRAAQRFFRSARSVVGFVPDRVTTDGHNSVPTRDPLDAGNVAPDRRK